jgi:hypothetical protein
VKNRFKNLRQIFSSTVQKALQCCVVVFSAWFYMLRAASIPKSRSLLQKKHSKIQNDSNEHFSNAAYFGKNAEECIFALLVEKMIALTLRHDHHHSLLLVGRTI